MSTPTDDELRDRMQRLDIIRERFLPDYEEKLDLSITDLARERVLKTGQFLWYDLCCGDLNAGKGLLSTLVQNGEKDIAKRISIEKFAKLAIT